jgi:hypothetical protein
VHPGQKLKIPAAGSTAKKSAAAATKTTTSAPVTKAAPAVELAPLKLVPVGTQPAAPAAPASDAPAAVPAKK